MSLVSKCYVYLDWWCRESWDVDVLVWLRENVSRTTYLTCFCAVLMRRIAIRRRMVLVYLAGLRIQDNTSTRHFFLYTFWTSAAVFHPSQELFYRLFIHWLYSWRILKYILATYIYSTMLYFNSTSNIYLTFNYFTNWILHTKLYIILRLATIRHILTITVIFKNWIYIMILIHMKI